MNHICFKMYAIAYIKIKKQKITFEFRQPISLNQLTNSTYRKKQHKSVCLSCHSEQNSSTGYWGEVETPLGIFVLFLIHNVHQMSMAYGVKIYW